MKIAHCLAAPGLSIVALAVLACSHEPPKPFVKDEMLHVSATVEAVDPASRMVSLRGPNGSASVVAGPEVHNFSQVKVGDTVQVAYYVGVAAQINKSGSTPEPQESTATYTAPKGAKPAGAVGHTITTTVKIESVDTSFDTVTFKRADGFVRTLAVESPEGKKYIRTLKPGDVVDVMYSEAVAVEVVPGS